MGAKGTFVVIDKEKKVKHTTDFTRALSCCLADCDTKYALSLFEEAKANCVDGDLIVWVADFNIGYVKYEKHITIKDIKEMFFSQMNSELVFTEGSCIDPFDMHIKECVNHYL